MVEMQKTKAIKGHQTLTMIVVYHISVKKRLVSICINSILHVKISRIYTEYVHVHVYIYIYVCDMCVCMCMCMCMYMYMYVYIYMCVYVCVCVCVCICISI